MKKKVVLVFTFEGMADWEYSYALAGINKSEAYVIKTMAIDKSPVRSMAGFTIFPDLDFVPKDLEDIDRSNTAMLILPGGDGWEMGKNNGIASLVYHCIENQIPVAAIGGVTLFLERLGILDKIERTIRGLDYLRAMVPACRGQAMYRKRGSVADGGIITAGGTAALEFADDIFETLRISDHAGLNQWFRYFQDKMVDC